MAGRLGTQTKEARREGAWALSMAGLKKEDKTTVSKATKRKKTGSKKTGGTKAENKVRKASKKFI